MRFLSSSFFSRISLSLAPEYSIGPFQILTKISRDICDFVFIVGVSDAGNKLFISVNDTSVTVSGVGDTGDQTSFQISSIP